MRPDGGQIGEMRGERSFGRLDDGDALRKMRTVSEDGREGIYLSRREVLWLDVVFHRKEGREERA